MGFAQSAARALILSLLRDPMMCAALDCIFSFSFSFAFSFTLSRLLHLTGGCLSTA